MIRAALIVLLLAGCGSKAPAPVSITYETDRFGVPYPVVEGKPYQLTDDERRRIGQAFVNEYCPP